MSRWQPNARERLEQAALELYTERGFDQTTVNDIAQRAGLTERTFFRHFADKREVLFSGQESLIDAVTDAVAAEPETVGPLDAVAAGYETADWDAESLKSVLEAIGTERGLKLGKAQAPVRVAVTGRSVGLPLFESLVVLGRERTLDRLRAARAKLG